VADGRIKAWHGCLIKSSSGDINDEEKATARMIQAGALEAFSKDFEIWQHKAPAIKPMAMKSEGPFLNNRKWYGQFYADRSDVETIQAPLNGTYHVPGVETPADRDHAIDDGLPF